MKSAMNRRKAKQEILLLLKQGSSDTFFSKLEEYPQHLLINALFIALCNQLEPIKWNAVSCFGYIVPGIAEKDLESARIIMRRFLWSLNDESGGIGWGAPEAMAEIMCHSKTLRREFLHMLISYMREDGDEPFQDGNFLEHPMLQRGLLWGVGRLCMECPDEMSGYQIMPDIMAYLDSTDLYVAGLAIWCLNLLGVKLPLLKLEKYVASSFELELFINNTSKIIKLSDLSKKVSCI